VIAHPGPADDRQAVKPPASERPGGSESLRGRSQRAVPGPAEPVVRARSCRRPARDQPGAPPGPRGVPIRGRCQPGGQPAPGFRT